MPKSRPASGRKPTLRRRAISRRNSQMQMPPVPDREGFERIAALIASPAPSWLADHLRRWAPGLFMDAGVHAQQPGRSEMIATLTEVCNAAALLGRAVVQPAVKEFLDAGGDIPMDAPHKFQMVLEEIRIRAERAARSPNLVTESGKTKAGRGPALPSGAYSPQVYCALLIGEAWRYFHGHYPPERNVKAARAADLYWQLSVGSRQSWGNKPLNAWRPHFREARSLADTSHKAEIRRHLAVSEYSAGLTANS